MLVRGHNQLNISFFALLIVSEKLINSSILPNSTNIIETFGLSQGFSYLLMFLIFTMGSHFPDLDLNLKIFYGKRPSFFYHRTFLTHSLLIHSFLLSIPLLLLFNLTSEQYLFIYFFELGVMTHLLGDILTGSIPFLRSNYIRNEMKISRFRFMSWVNKPIYKLFNSFQTMIKYFISPFFVILFILGNLLDFPIIILAIFFEQKLSRIGSKIIIADKFEIFWKYFEPWVLSFILLQVFNPNIHENIYINYILTTTLIIMVLSIRIKLFNFKISYSNILKVFEKNHNISFFVPGILVILLLLS